MATQQAKVEETQELLEEIFDELVDQFSRVQLARYNDQDPSMAALGQGAWQRQVRKAERALKDALSDILATVQSRLDDGEFHDR